MQLLKKTITAYFIFSVILLLVAIPVFYWTLKRLMVANVDENLIATKTRIMPQLMDAAAGNREGVLRLPGTGYDILFEKEGARAGTHPQQQQPEKKTDSLYNGESTDSYPGRTLPNRLLA